VGARETFPIPARVEVSLLSIWYRTSLIPGGAKRLKDSDINRVKSLRLERLKDI